MGAKNNLKKYFKFISFLFLCLIVFSFTQSKAEADEVKYFGVILCIEPSFNISRIKCLYKDVGAYIYPWKCGGGQFDFNRECHFDNKNKIHIDDPIKPSRYYEVHYNKGKLIYSKLFHSLAYRDYLPKDNCNNESMKYVVESRNIYGSNKRIIEHIHNPERHPCFHNQRSHKTIYGAETIKTKFFDHNGKLEYESIELYKDNLLVKDSMYEPKGDLSYYTIYDHKNKRKRLYDANHKMQTDNHILYSVD